MNVLLVEDENALADVIDRNLRARHYDVAVEATAEGALLRMAELWPDVLVLDVNLPGLTGWEILRRLSAADRARLGVIVISAAPISQKRIDEFRPARTLQKPFPIDALMRAVGQVAPATEPVGEKEES
jgi:DNA-binding response OmpR family regulator